MTSLDIEFVDLTSVVGEWDLTCDYQDPERKWLALRPHGPARWVARLRTCGCGNGGVRLLCQECHDLFMSEAAEFTVLLCGGCDEVFTPARTAFASFERLEKR